MSKKNRLLDMVFGNIIGDHEQIKLYDRFLNTDKILNIDDNEQTNKIKKSYLSTIKTIEPHLIYLSKLEELIVQWRCQKKINTGIKFSESRGYIYARTQFYSIKHTTKTVVSLVGKTSDHGTNIELYYLNKPLMDKAIKNLNLIMEKEISNTIENIKSLKMLL